MSLKIWRKRWNWEREREKRSINVMYPIVKAKNVNLNSNMKEKTFLLDNAIFSYLKKTQNFSITFNYSWIVYLNFKSSAICASFYSNGQKHQNVKTNAIAKQMSLSVLFNACFEKGLVSYKKSHSTDFHNLFWIYINVSYVNVYTWKKFYISVNWYYVHCTMYILVDEQHIDWLFQWINIKMWKRLQHFLFNEFCHFTFYLNTN